MALLDFLKNKKEADKAKETKVAKASITKKTEIVKEEKKEVKAPKVSVKEGKFSYDIVRDPHISEKGTYQAEKNKYTFKVFERSNKLEIKKAIEGVYGVNVISVNVMHVPHKKRRLGKTEGFKKGYKKALVTIKEGQKIEIF